MQPDKVNEIWPSIIELVQDGCNRMNGRHSPETIKALVESKCAQLWVVKDAAIQAIVVTELIIYPLKKYCRIILVSGDGLKDWKHLIGVIEYWARSKGCHGMEAICRKGWSRISDYNQTHVFIEKEL